MDQSDRFVGVEYFLICHPNIPPMLVESIATDTSMKRVWILVEARVNKGGYFVVLTYPS